MAFVFNNFATFEAAGLGTVNAYAVHKYTTNDTAATVLGSGYFNSITKMLHQGDLILISSAVNGSPVPNIAEVTSATGAATVTTAGLANTTQTFNSVYTIGMGVASLATTSTEQYHPVPTTGSPLRFYGCADVAGAGGTSTYRLTQVGGSAFATLSFSSGYTKGALITGTVSANPVLTQGTDVIKLDMSATSNTGVGLVHMVLMVG